MTQYQASQNIENETQRLSLLASIANEDARRVFFNIKKIYPGIVRILDAGCGTGEAFPLLKEVFPGCYLVGLDQSEQALTVAKARNLADKIIQADLTSLAGSEIADEKPFDLVYLRNTLLHISQPQIVLENLINLLKSQGVLALQEPDWDTASAGWSDFMVFKTAFTAAMRAGGINPVMGQSVKDLLNAANLKNVQSQVFTTTVKPTTKTWEILYLLLDVVGPRIEPFLKLHGIISSQEMKTRLVKARENPANSFITPAWVIGWGESGRRDNIENCPMARCIETSFGHYEYNWLCVPRATK